MTGSSVAAPRFDWYAATINASPDTLRDVLCDGLGGSAVAHRPQNGYHHGELIVDAAGRTIATLLHGGNGDIPHAFSTSDNAPAFASLIRDVYPARHRVSRFDAAIDFDDGPSTWTTLLELCKKLASGERVEGDPRTRVGKIRTNYMGDWLHGEDGRTFGLGSFKSAVYARLYEKGVKERQDCAKRGVQPDPGVTDNWVRLEVQVRPDGDSKRRASSSTPAQAFGYSAWSRELLRRVDGSDVERVHVKERRDSDHERAMQHMVMQYGKHLLIDVANLGGWAALGEDLRRRYETGSGASGIWGNPDERPF